MILPVAVHVSFLLFALVNCCLLRIDEQVELGENKLDGLLLPLLILSDGVDLALKDIQVGVVGWLIKLLVIPLQVVEDL